MTKHEPTHVIVCMHQTGFDECPSSCNIHCYNEQWHAYTENQAKLIRDVHLINNENHVVEIRSLI